MNEKKIGHKLIDYIHDNTNADEISGNLKCKKCKSNVSVDWFEMSVTCSGCDEL